jgi:predicted aspartyl protease
VGDERKVLCKKVGPVEVHWGEKSYFTSALLLLGRKTPVMGVLGLESLGLTVDPVSQKLRPALTFEEGNMDFLMSANELDW